MKAIKTVVAIVAIFAGVMITNEAVKSFRCINITQHYYHLHGEVQAKVAEQMTEYRCWSTAGATR